MLNIVIPLAGAGSRFLREGYWRPKPFVKALGKELVVWLIENLALCSMDTVVLIFNRNPELGLSPVNFFELIEEAFTKFGENKPETLYVSLDEPTSGAAETALYGIDALPTNRLQLPCVLLDGDTFYNTNVLNAYRAELAKVDPKNPSHSIGGCLFVFDDDMPEESIYSYVELDHGARDGRVIVTIKEKDKTGMSPLACSGCYCFHQTLSLREEIKSAMKLRHTSEAEVDSSQELYTSTIVGSMLKKGGIFTIIKLDRGDFTVLGTPSQLREFITSKGTETERRRFCFDLDNTLVTSPLVPGDYTTCRPISRVVDYVRALFTSGHYIIIHTARRMRTHRGNVGSVVADVGMLTLRQLEHFRIPYHEIFFGKPFADFYIDDKAVIPYVDHLQKETGF